jgi:3-oxoacyl-[acyl-carrier protein] reductase
MNVEGRAAIVTGAGTGGIGRATALRLARLGCSVLVNYRRSREGAEQTAAEAQALGVKAVAFQADVGDDSACRAMVKQATEAFGRLDILVNNAGTTSYVNHADLDKVTEALWDRILAVNLKGPFFSSRAAKPAMEAVGGGEIVVTSSVAGFPSLAGGASSIPYSASKAAVNNLVATLARVLAASNIRVNAVAPGWVAGSWTQGGFGEAYETVRKIVEQKTPLKRVVEPDDAAEAIVSLITGSDLVTGHVLPIEGGMLIAQ